MSEAGQFHSPAEHYDRFMGRYTPSLAAALVDAVGVAECAARNPGVDAREGVAEELPWEDGAFNAVLSCLVIAFMRDADRGVREMTRVTRPRGMVAICMWDIAGGGMTMLRIFWSVMRELHPAVPGEQRRPGTRKGDIADRLERAGLTGVSGGELNAHAEYSGFDDFWDPFTLAVGPAGQALASLAPEDRWELSARHMTVMIESFWARMQVELLNRKRWRTRVELATAIHDYIEIWHNTRRRHSALNMLTPTEYDKKKSNRPPPSPPDSRSATPRKPG